MVKSELPTADQPGVHTLITCTLCSCCHISLLGLSPKWHKSRSYQARAVREPRRMDTSSNLFTGLLALGSCLFNFRKMQRSHSSGTIR
mmetsp:Transcript_28188/g.46693  ORF Transcript_28188/g.46693 Transcript_28188/m.46693 type:complete len:88 (+) Transcript_28188:299-562(+)